MGYIIEVNIRGSWQRSANGVKTQKCKAAHGTYVFSTLADANREIAAQTDGFTYRATLEPFAMEAAPRTVVGYTIEYSYRGKAMGPSDNTSYTRPNESLRGIVFGDRALAEEEAKKQKLSMGVYYKYFVVTAPQKPITFAIDETYNFACTAAEEQLAKVKSDVEAWDTFCTERLALNQRLREWIKQFESRK